MNSQHKIWMKCSRLVMHNHRLVSLRCGSHQLWHHFCHNNLWRPGLDYVWTTGRVMGSISNIRTTIIHQNISSHQEYDGFNIKLAGTERSWDSKWMFLTKYRFNHKVVTVLRPTEVRQALFHLNWWTASWHEFKEFLVPCLLWNRRKCVNLSWAVTTD